VSATKMNFRYNIGYSFNFYTIGSHRDEVLRIQGTPKSINTYNASGYEQLSYGNSTVDISLSTQKVIEWSNFDNNLKVKLTPGINTTANNFYTIGSHRDEVLRIQGTPKSINIYKASGYEQFSYGNSTVDISLSTQRVIEWSNFSNNLKVKLGAEAEAALTQSNSNNENNSDEPVKKIENKSVPNNTQVKTNQQVKSNTSVTDKKLTYKEFAEKFKVKYPQYKEVDDYTLALKIIEKYPQYKSWVEMNQQKMAEEQNKYPEWLKEYYDKFPRAEENGNPKTENEQVKQTVAQQKTKSKSTQPNLYIVLAIFGFFFLLALIPSFQKMLKKKTSPLRITQMKKYFYSDGREKKGPFSFEELKKEEINPNTLIWFEGLGDWTPIKEIKELEEILQLSPPPIPTIESVSYSTNIILAAENKDNPANNYEQTATFQAVKQGMFAKPFSFEGRIRRTEYGITFIVYFIVITFLNAIFVPEAEGALAGYFILFIPMLWFLWAQGAKRCHDMGHSGWYQIIPFYVIWMIFTKGEKGIRNKYGLNPKLN
jgi:uncharacterized membrane protein YhaH (DUF805 family)